MNIRKLMRLAKREGLPKVKQDYPFVYQNRWKTRLKNGEFN